MASFPPEIRTLATGVFQTVITALLVGGVTLAWSVSERVSRLEVQLAEQTKTYERDRGKADAEFAQLHKDIRLMSEQLTQISAQLDIMVMAGH